MFLGKPRDVGPPPLLGPTVTVQMSSVFTDTLTLRHCAYHTGPIMTFFTVIDFRYQVIDAIKSPTSQPEKNRGLSHWS